MADTVRSLMELMVPELEDYERRGYFSRAEITAIVNRRQKFEYALRRRNAVKLDFLRYAEYEWKLERLRRLRRRERKIEGKKSLADYGVVRRVHFIFERATRKFKGDLSMWMAWLNFCKVSHSKRQVSKAVTKVLKLHPNASFLWTYAAAWEFEGNSNPVAARLLMQTGLRNCPRDTSLWLEYFRMELLYAHKLLARRKALGISATNDAAEHDDAAAAADGAILKGALAKLVYAEAVKAAPLDAHLRRRFLEVAAAVPCQGTPQLVQHIASSMRDDFAESPSGWIEYVRCVADGITGSDQEHTREACNALLEGLSRMPTAEMQGHAVAFAAERIAAIDDQSAGCSTATATERDSAVQLLIDTLDALATHAVSGEPHADVRAARVAALLRCGRPAAAFDAADAAVSSSAADWRLWVQHFEACALKAALHAGRSVGRSSQPALTATAALLVPDDIGPAGCSAAVARALKCVAPEDAWRLWVPAATLLIAAADEPGCRQGLQLLTASAVAALRIAAHEDVGQAVAALYSAIWFGRGSDAAEEFARGLDSCPSSGVAYWEARLACLLAKGDEQRWLGDASSTSEVDSVFERAVQAHGGESVELWLLWVRHRVSTQKPYGQLTYRATKELRPELADCFAVACRKLQEEAL